MGKFLGIDCGLKRVGLALSDELHIIASPLQTVQAHEAISFIKDLAVKEKVEGFIVGLPKDLLNRDTDGTNIAREFVKKLEKACPGLPIVLEDERFTSKMAFQTMLDGGMKKQQRRDKGNIDKISAAILLQSFLDRKKSKQ